MNEILPWQIPIFSIWFARILYIWQWHKKKRENHLKMIMQNWVPTKNLIQRPSITTVKIRKLIIFFIEFIFLVTLTMTLYFWILFLLHQWYRVLSSHSWKFRFPKEWFLFFFHSHFTIESEIPFSQKLKLQLRSEKNYYHRLFWGALKCGAASEHIRFWNG